jgi:hypothetical protein
MCIEVGHSDQRAINTTLQVVTEANSVEARMMWQNKPLGILLQNAWLANGGFPHTNIQNDAKFVQQPMGSEEPLATINEFGSCVMFQLWRGQPP